MTTEYHDPIPTFAFAIKIQGMTVGWFTECSGLTMERAVTTQPEGGVNDYEHQLPGPVSYTKVTLKRGLADNILWDWFQQGVYDGKVERRNVTIVLLKPDQTEARHWDMTNAYPLRWAGLDFQSDSNQVNVETLEIAAGGGPEQALIQRALEDTVASLPLVAVKPAVALAADIDVGALAQKVYALLKREAQIEQERLGR